MENSRFYQLGIDALNTETKKLDDFFDMLDKNPAERKNRMTEYKCARYRYAGIINVWCQFYHNHRVSQKNAGTRYLVPEVNDILSTVPEYVALYDNASDDEKQDYALYYGVSAFTDSKITELESKLPSATDWENIELQERIGGLRFAKECLNEAWQKRGGVSA